MNELTKHEPQSVIVFFDGTRKFISTKQADALFQLSTKQQQFMVDGGMYKFSAISKIITLEEFYRQFPNEKPSGLDYYDGGNEMSVEERIKNYRPEKRINAIKGMLKGLNEFIDNYENPKHSLTLRKDWEQKLELAQKGE